MNGNQMSIQMGLLNEMSFTMWASKGFFSRMRPQVNNHIVFSFHDFGANGALKAIATKFNGCNLQQT